MSILWLMVLYRYAMVSRAFLVLLVQVRVVQDHRNLVGPCRGILVDLDMERRVGTGACREITRLSAGPP